jgi:hypothetical protein
MITREEYNKALDIIEGYHIQIFKIDLTLLKNNNKTKIEDWEKYNQCSTRLRNGITNVCRVMNREKVLVEYIEDITKKDFCKARYLGIKTWREFEHLRGL